MVYLLYIHWFTDFVLCFDPLLDLVFRMLQQFDSHFLLQTAKQMWQNPHLGINQPIEND